MNDFRGRLRNFRPARNECGSYHVLRRSSYQREAGCASTATFLAKAAVITTIIPGMAKLILKLGVGCLQVLTFRGSGDSCRILILCIFLEIVSAFPEYCKGEFLWGAKNDLVWENSNSNSFLNSPLSLVFKSWLSLNTSLNLYSDLKEKKKKKKTAFK